jgi:hypothetical protein
MRRWLRKGAHGIDVVAVSLSVPRLQDGEGDLSRVEVSQQAAKHHPSRTFLLARVGHRAHDHDGPDRQRPDRGGDQLPPRRPLVAPVQRALLAQEQRAQLGARRRALGLGHDGGRQDVVQDGSVNAPHRLVSEGEEAGGSDGIGGGVASGCARPGHGAIFAPGAAHCATRELGLCTTSVPAAFEGLVSQPMLVALGS